MVSFSPKRFQAFDFKELDQEAQKVEAGSYGLLFLPYLIGERTPYMDL